MSNIAIIGPAADPNADGETNLVEFATAQNPLTSTQAKPILIKNGATLEFTYTRANAALADGVTFTVEWSDTLAANSWSIAGVTQQIFADTGIVQTVKASVLAGGERRFMRLRIFKP